MIKTLSYLFLGGLGALMLTRPSFAYIPSSYFITESWVNLHVKNRQQSYKMTSQVYAIDQGQQESSTFFKETLVFYPKSETLKIWATNDSGQLLYYRESKLSSQELPRLLLFALDAKTLTDQFIQRGIPVLNELKQAQYGSDAERLKDDQVTLKRMNDQVAWVIAQKGSKTGSSSQTQVWFEKDTFYPLKLVWREAESDVPYEFRYEFQGGASQKGFSYPKVISVFNQDSQLILRSKLSELTLGSEGAEFGMPHPRVQGLTPAGEASPAKLKSLLKLYDQLIR